MIEMNIGLVLTFNIFLQIEYQLCYSTTQSLMNNTEIDNYSDINIESNLTKLYDELIEILNTDDVGNVSQFNTSQSRNRRIYFPGTLWCGVIKLTVSNDEIGYFFDTDMCCKEHELCPREKYYVTTTRPTETTRYDSSIFHPRPPQTTIHYPTAPYPTYYPPPHQLPHYPTPPSQSYPYHPPHYPQHQQWPHLPPYEGPNQQYLPHLPQTPIHLPQHPHGPHSSQPIQHPNQQGLGHFQQQNLVHYLPPPSARKNTQLDQQTSLSSSSQPTQAPILQPFQNQTSEQQVQLVPRIQNYTPSQEAQEDLEDLSRMMKFPKVSNVHQRWAVGDSDCECDMKFYSCLKRVNNLISRKVGIIYFNLLHSQCITFDHPVVRCAQRQGFMGWRCIDYQVDNTEPMVSQWRDNPYFHIMS